MLIGTSIFSISLELIFHQMSFLTRPGSTILNMVTLKREMSNMRIGINQPYVVTTRMQPALVMELSGWVLLTDLIMERKLKHLMILECGRQFQCQDHQIILTIPIVSQENLDLIHGQERISNAIARGSLDPSQDCVQSMEANALALVMS